MLNFFILIHYDNHLNQSMLIIKMIIKKNGKIQNIAYFRYKHNNKFNNIIQQCEKVIVIFKNEDMWRNNKYSILLQYILW